MHPIRLLLPAAAILLSAATPAQTLIPNSPVHGILESYFYSTRLDRGNH